MPYLPVFLFFALFFLILIESIYFLRKNTTSGINEVENQNNTKNWVLPFFFFLIILVAVPGFIFFLLRNKSIPQTPGSSSPIPTLFPTRIIFPSPNLTQTLTPSLSPTLTVSPTSSPSPTGRVKPSPAKTPTPTKKPTPTLRPSSTPKPSPKKLTQIMSPTALPIGNPVTEANNQEATSSKEIVIVPKLPVAGSMQQTVIYLFSALGIIALGILL